MIAKPITYFGDSCVVICDAKCNKAWGINHRPRIQLSDNDADDCVFLADDELGEAPVDPGTYEAGDAKPVTQDERLNRWCVRECERSKVVDAGEEFDFNDFSKRVYNLPESELDK